MEAKDSRISDAEIIELILQWEKTAKEREPLPQDLDVADLAIAVKEAQADISFPLGVKEGKKAGVRGMIEEIESKFMIKDSPNPDFLPEGLILISSIQWQIFKSKLLKGENERRDSGNHQVSRSTIFNRPEGRSLP